MATIAEIKNELIGNIMAIEDEDLLVDFSNFVAYSKKSIETTKFSKYQKLMLEMSEDDLKNGRVYTEEQVDKMDEEWLS